MDAFADEPLHAKDIAAAAAVLWALLRSPIPLPPTTPMLLSSKLLTHIVGRAENGSSEIWIGDSCLQIHSVYSIDQYAHVARGMLCQVSNSRCRGLISTIHQGFEKFVELRREAL